MSRRIRRLQTFALFVAVGGLTAALPSGCRDASRTDALRQTGRPTLTVRAIHPVTRMWPRALHATGTIAPWQEVVIGSEVGGLRLLRRWVEEGDWVKKGQLLMELNPGTLEAELSLSRAELAEAEALAAEASLAAGRARALRDTGAISERAVEEALSAEEAGQFRLAAARARMEVQTLRSSYVRIMSPDDGLISSVSAVEGAMVQVGEELMRLHRKGRLEWRAEVPGPELSRAFPGQAAILQSKGIEPVTGRVRMVSPQVDPETRTGIVYVDLEPSDHIRAGLFARGELLLEPREALIVPETAILSRDGYTYVFGLEEEKVRRIKVATGRWRDREVEIVAGLGSGTKIVESGVGFLSDGVTVRLADPATDSGLAGDSDN